MCAVQAIHIGINPMNPSRVVRLRAAPRCGARNRAGQPCQSPAMRGKKRCRLHGGKSPGAPSYKGNGRYKHGRRSAVVVAVKRAFKAIVREVRDAD